MKRTYQRSQILDFADLSEVQQSQAISLLDETLAAETQYVLWDSEPLPLCNFLSINNPLFQGQYGLSVYSCYFIRLSRHNEAATVVYAYC